MLIQVSIKIVEALIGRHSRRPFVAQSPLSDLSGRISFRFQKFCHCDILGTQIVLTVPANIAMACIETRHQNAARRSAYSRAGIEISEPHPVLSESINMWGLDELLTIAA